MLRTVELVCYKSPEKGDWEFTYLQVVPALGGARQVITSTGGPRLVRILGPGKNHTSEIRTSRYYIVNFH